MSWHEMIDLTPQEAACIWLIHRELVADSTDDLVEAFVTIAARVGFPTDRTGKMAEAYVSGLSKLSCVMRESVDVRDWLRVIEGGKSE